VQKKSSFSFAPFQLCSVLLALVLLTYSQTLAFSWDEGFHLLAAQLIKSGKRPYLDFAFAQTPLNAYWNAGWMWLLGEKWRSIQAVDAILTTSAVVLAAGFLRSRWREQGQWGPIAVLAMAGLNPMTVEFGTIGQAYAIGLLLIVGSFCLTVESVRRSSAYFAALAGLLSGAAAGSTLLTAPAAPVLLMWMLANSSARKRLLFGAVFMICVFVSLLPLLILLAQSPEKVIFDMFRYHMFYRRSDWPGATRHDLELFASFVDSPQALIFGILTAVGIWFIARNSGADDRALSSALELTGRQTTKTDRLPHRSEFYLCGWLALALGLYTSTAHPTFVQYYVFIIPFLAILSSVGLSAIGNQLGLRHPHWLTAGVCLLACLSLAKEIYDKRDDQSWPRMEALARKVDEVTPPGGSLYADEHIYFLTKRIPPPGNEYISSHKLRLPAALSERVHVVPQPEWDRRILGGVFDTVETCEDEDWIKPRKLEEIYRRKQELNDCAVFWDRGKK
jgi:hypothetical protein